MSSPLVTIQSKEVRNIFIISLNESVIVNMIINEI